MLISLLKAARLRTLPLAVSGIGIGCAWAWLEGHFQPISFVLGIITAVLLQVLSNFANDYGDFQKGTDTAAGRRDRVLAAGDLTVSQMRTAIIATALLSLLSGIGLLWNANISDKFITYLIVGIIAILAAITYTVGKNAYGYFGFGDVFVFVFFGLVSVFGMYYLHHGSTWNPVVLFSAGAFGLLCTAVLNINNIRDIASDTLAGKTTIPVKIGYRKALQYHTFLLFAGLAIFILSVIWHNYNTESELSSITLSLHIGIFLPTILLLTTHLKELKKAESTDRTAFNKQLKKLSLSLLLMSTLFAAYGAIHL